MTSAEWHPVHGWSKAKLREAVTLDEMEQVWLNPSVIGMRRDDDESGDDVAL